VNGSIMPGYYGIEAGQSAVGDILKWWVEGVCEGDEKLHAELSAEAAKLKPGLYRFPWASSMAETKDPAYVEKLKKGPVGVLTVIPSGPFNMGRSLGLWAVYLVVVGIFVAYVTGRHLAPGTHYLGVFRLAGTVAFLAYSGAQLPAAIWWGKPLGVAFREILDGLLYALLTAGAFGWLWPR